ncbi:hypothetical protein GCM10010466_15090 [Planomonospora alba]|uniref:Uncharacterized protein n=1 Tax=Planomonospora alba TaxID=161354 RepID=A0ABP6MY34_9ACTN
MLCRSALRRAVITGKVNAPPNSDDPTAASRSTIPFIGSPTVRAMPACPVRTRTLSVRGGRGIRDRTAGPYRDRVPAEGGDGRGRAELWEPGEDPAKSGGETAGAPLRGIWAPLPLDREMSGMVASSLN